MSFVAGIVIGPIRLYQRVVSPALPATCRYFPTCSAYAVEALQLHGALRGSWLALHRLGRCQPWSKREYFDPVPQTPSVRANPDFPSIREPALPAGSSPSGGQHAGHCDTDHHDAGRDNTDFACRQGEHLAVPTIDHSAGSRSA